MWTKRAQQACSVFCLGGSLLSAGCHQHVALQAPAAAAPEAERVLAYSKLRPLSYHETKTTMTSDWMGVTTERNVDYLQLAGGQRIYYPEDLLEVVPVDSPAARAASDSRSSRKLGTGLQLGGAAGITTGVVLALLTLLSADPSTGKLNTTPLHDCP